ncbi:MAG: rod shape-determining protein MreD [Betaproteobacteria bacterium]|nr:rod shape-determining protein MreD [Betaproteobacteria bacterium]
MASLAPRPQEILLPVKRSFIAVTLVGALLLNLLPWSGAAALAKPDFVALTLLYWYTYEPRKIGFTSALVLGLLMDISDASLFGQHALGYTVLAYAAIVLHRRVRRFALGAQMLHATAMLLLPLIAMLVVRLAAGAEAPSMLYLVACLTGGALWPLLRLLLPLQQRATTDPDHASI